VTTITWLAAQELVFPPTSNAPIIARYRTAARILFAAHLKVSPHAREWDSALALRSEVNLIVKAARQLALLHRTPKDISTEGRFIPGRGYSGRVGNPAASKYS
jgi:hypothetical protein